MKQLALDFVDEILPEADGFAQDIVAENIAAKVWPVILAWRSVKR